MAHAPIAAAPPAAPRPAGARPPRTPHEIRRIAVEARRDPRTVQAAYRGECTDLARASVADAAIRLGYAPPPDEPESA